MTKKLNKVEEVTKETIDDIINNPMLTQAEKTSLINELIEKRIRRSIKFIFIGCCIGMAVGQILGKLFPIYKLW